MVNLNEKVLKKLTSELKKMFVGKKELRENRPILASIHYSKEGHVEFSNSHVAVRLLDVHEGLEYVVPEMHGNYPDLGRIFDSIKGSTITLNTKDMSDMLSPFKTEKLEYVKLTFDEDGVTFQPPYPAEHIGVVEDKATNRDYVNVIYDATLKCNLDLEEPFRVALNTKYIYNAMMFFKTQKIETVTMTFTTSLRPVLFEHSNVQYLVNPIRVGEWT